MSKKKVTIGAVGQTKAGKTTTIAFLTNSTEQIREMSAGDDNRTKSTIDYHFDVNYSGNLMIEEIVPNLSKFCGSDDGNVDKYNENVRNTPLLREVFKMTEIARTNYSDARDYVRGVLDGFKGKVLSTSELKQIINREGIDDYIVRLIFKVGATQILKQYISDNNLDLVIRDTRGLLDIVIEESTSDIKIRNTKSLSTLGLEGLDAIVFFCSQSYPNITSTIYKDMLSKLMKSIPVFLVYRDELFKSAFKTFSKDNPADAYEIMKLFIKTIHDNKIDAYEDLDDEFYETMVFFSKFGITSDANGNWNFNEPYFKLRNIEYTIPNSKALKNQGFVSENDMNDVQKQDYDILRNCSIAIFASIIDDLNKLHIRMNNLLKDGKNKLFEALNKLIHDINVQTRLMEDYKKYDLGRGCVTGPKCTRPVLDCMNTIKLNDDTLDNNVRLMGRYGGITSRVHGGGNLQYPLTAVLGATSSNWLFKLIDEIDTSDLLNSQDLDSSDRDVLVKKILRYVYLRRYVDQNATIDGYLLADRYKIQDKVNELRAGNHSNDAFLTAVTKLIEEFNTTLQEMGDIADVYIQDRHNSSN